MLPLRAACAAASVRVVHDSETGIGTLHVSGEETRPPAARGSDLGCLCVWVCVGQQRLQTFDRPHPPAHQALCGGHNVACGKVPRRPMRARAIFSLRDLRTRFDFAEAEPDCSFSMLCMQRRAHEKAWRRNIPGRLPHTAAALRLYELG